MADAIQNKGVEIMSCHFTLRRLLYAACFEDQNRINGIQSLLSRKIFLARFYGQPAFALGPV
jgi:hypothetical protein